MTEYILKNIFFIFGEEKVKIIIYYGNKQGNDIDVFVVTAGEDEYNCLHQDELDITFVGDRHLNGMIKHLDPLLTEPVFTGEVIFGNISQIKNDLYKVYSSRSAVDYLMNKALLYFQWANIHLQKGKLTSACNCARFSLSFYCFAIHYKKGGKIAAFSTVLDESSNRRAIIEKATKMAKNIEIPTFESAKNILAKVLEILTKGSK